MSDTSEAAVHSFAVGAPRARVLDACAWLGVQLHADASARGGLRTPETDSTVSGWVIPSNEKVMTARDIRARLAERNVRHAG